MTGKQKELPLILDQPFLEISDLISTRHLSIMVIGSRDSGKSVFLGSTWCEWKKKFDLLIFFCNNPQAVAYGFLSDEDRRFVYRSYCPQIIEDLDFFQTLTNNYFDIGNFFDDCSSKSGNKFDEYIQQIFLRGRNINMSVYFSTQSYSFIDKNNRGNCDYAFIANCKAELVEPVAEKFLYYMVDIPDEITSRTKRINYLVRWLKQRTKDYHFVVLDYKDDDLIFQYKADNEKLKEYCAKVKQSDMEQRRRASKK